MLVEVGAAGKVDKASITESNAPRVADCIVRRARKWHFDDEDGSGKTYAIPFVFADR